MKKLTTGQKIATKLLSGICSVVLLLLPVAIFGTFWLANPAALKQLLADAKVYHPISEMVAKQSAQQVSVSLQGTGGLENDAVQRAVRDVFTPKMMQAEVESLIDENYRWLEGEKSEPTVTISFEKQKRKLAEALSSEAVRSVQQKPICTAEQLYSYQLHAQLDLRNLPCRPGGDSIRAFESQMHNAASAQFNTMQQSREGDLALSAIASPSASFGVQAEQVAQGVYWLLKHGFILTLSLLLLVGTLAAVIVRNKYYWLEWVKSPLLSAGVVLAISAAVAILSTQTNLLGAASLLNGEAGRTVATISRPLLTIVALGAGGYIMAGLFAILAIKTRRKNVGKPGGFSNPEG